MEKSCKNCFDRVCSVCVVHLITVEYERQACEFWRHLPCPVPVQEKNQSAIHLQVLLVCLVFLLPSMSFAAPLEVLGDCFATDHQAIENWESRLPVVDANGDSYLYSIGAYTPSAAGANLIVPYTVKLGTGAIKNYTVTFPSCDVGQQGRPERQFSLESLIIVAVGMLIAILSFNFSKWRH